MIHPTVAPYGSWKSPITADLIASGSVRLSSVTLDAGNVYWLESRPTEGGRYVLVRLRPDGAIQDVTPRGTNVRTRVHEYGGASYLIHGDTLFFSDFADQRLYRQDKGDDPMPITPVPDVPAGLRYADPRLAPDRRTIVCIRELHTPDGKVLNELVALAADGSGDMQVIATGHDFYAYPRISPDGRRLAWIQWDHPNMPWDGTELRVADLSADGTLSNERHIAGGSEESIFQPEWSPDGVLHFVSDRTNWWNIYKEETGKIVALAPMEAEIGDPQWVLDARVYGFLSDSRIACVITRNGMDALGVIAADSNEVIEITTPFNAFADIATDGSDRIAVIAAGSEIPSSVALLEVSGTTANIEVIRRSNDAAIDPGYFSPAQPIEFPTGNGLTAHALFYEPKNRDYVAPEGERPPLLVFSHGGPTGATNAGLNLGIQFWTSRGFAVADVNYGGSTGYGREYRNRLRGTWGIVDVEDCINAAIYLADQGLVDRSRMAIRGGSAGGYTTLAALTFSDIFGAGASYYGVADIEMLVQETHKFESRYIDMLIGPYPEMREVYRERSPIHHTDRLSAPMIIFQGLEDAVVPPSQAEAMVAALERKELPYAYLPFEGEQHGFRRAENIKRSLEAELYFYGKVFGFEPTDKIEPVTIENL